MTLAANSNSASRRSVISDEVRKLIIQQYSVNKMKIIDISRMFNVPRTTVSSIISNFNKNGQETKLKRGGDYSSKLNDEMKDSVRSWIDENAAITLKNLCTKVQEKYNIVVSSTTIHRTIKDFHYSLKRISLIPVRRNTESTIENRLQYPLAFN